MLDSRIGVLLNEVGVSANLVGVWSWRGDDD
jgi:hypothetical protein